MERLAFTATTRDDMPWADEIVRLPGVSVAEAVAALQEALPGGFASTADTALADALLTAGAQSVRHAHQMRLALPLEGYDDTEFLPFAPDATPPVTWVEVLPAFDHAQLTAQLAAQVAYEFLSLVAYERRARDARA